MDYKKLVLGFSFVTFAWESYLGSRQRKKLEEKKVPFTLKEIVTEEEFLKANHYSLDKSKFGAIVGIFEFIQQFLVFIFDLIPYFWNLSGEVLESNLGFSSTENEIYRSLIFFMIVHILSTVINIPFSLYSTFVIEERHGFNKQTLSLFFSDMVKTILLTYLFGIPLLAGFLKIIQSTGDNFFFYVWIFIFSVQMIMIVIYPTIIQPLFNKFTPLPEGSLKEKIEALAKSIEFPLTKLFVVDGSKRSSHSNAYFFGLFKNKRIVLYDTLIKDLNEEEVCAVLAHELGHWQHSHMPKMIVVSEIHMFLILYSFSYFIKNDLFYGSFGFDVKPIIIGFILFQYIYHPIEYVFSFLMNVYSRKNEFEADAFAVKMKRGDELRAGLIKIHTKNLGNLNPDKMYSAWHYSHPPLIERLRGIEEAQAKSK